MKNYDRAVRRTCRNRGQHLDTVLDECPVTMVVEYLTPASLMGRQPNSQTTILDRYGGYETSFTTI